MSLYCLAKRLLRGLDLFFWERAELSCRTTKVEKDLDGLWGRNLLQKVDRQTQFQCRRLVVLMFSKCLYLRHMMSLASCENQLETRELLSQSEAPPITRIVPCWEATDSPKISKRIARLPILDARADVCFKS